MKTWYIEDAGGGCKAFSEVIVLVCEDPQEIYISQIPLFWEGLESLEEKVLQAALEIMQKAGVQKTDQLLVCSGNIFFALHEWLTQNQYNWETTKMEGLAHYTAEESFQQQLVKAGFPPYLKLAGREYREFYQIIEAWVRSDPQRKIYLKNQQIRRRERKNKYTLKANGYHATHCSKCHRIILPYSSMIEIHYRQRGKKIQKHYHLQCTPEQPKKFNLITASLSLEESEFTAVQAKNREVESCYLCHKPLNKGEIAFFGYLKQKLIAIHPDCLPPHTRITKASGE